MNVKQRIMGIRLADKLQRQPQYAEALGISISNHKVPYDALSKGHASANATRPSEVATEELKQ